MALNDLGEEIFERPITLPRFNLPPIDDAEDRKELAAKLAERRIIRNGLDAWQAAAADKAHSFEAYKIIGSAFLIGRDRALKATGLSTPHGRLYSLAFRQWMKAFGFGDMPNTTRKYIVILTENAAAIEVWRAGLSQHERNRLGNAQHMVRRWQASLKTGRGKCLAYVRRDAIAGWRKFLSSVSMLPPDQAGPLWATVKAAADAA
jgi:hypothetical protein